MPLSWAQIYMRRMTLAAIGVAMVLASVSGCGGGGGGGTTTVPPVGGLIAPGTTPFTNPTREASTSACTANAHASGRARWTVLVYIDAASNLQDDSNLNVGQIASVGSDGTNLNVVVQWKQAASQPYFPNNGIDVSSGDTPAFDGTRRYYIRPHSASDVATIEGPYPASSQSVGAGGNVTPLNADRLADPATNGMYGAAANTSDMGNYLVLQDFVDWGAATYPADNLLVVIWDHGSAALAVDIGGQVVSKTAVSKSTVTKVLQNLKTTGTVATKSTKAPSAAKKRSVCFDTNTGSQITTEQLPLAFANLGKTTTYGPTQKCDVITVDCSLEATTEVEYQLAGSARLYTGTEESPPGQGLAYDAWLGAIKSGGGANPCAVGNSIVSTFVYSPTYAGQNVYQMSLTNSMVDLTAMQNLITNLDAFGKSLYNHIGNYGAQIAYVRDNLTQDYDPDSGYQDYKDLYDFAYNIRTYPGAPSDLVTAAANLQTAMVSSTSGAILVSAHGSDPPTYTQKYSTGLTIFCPTPADYDSTYAQLAISQAGAAPNWNLFISSQTQ